MVKRNMRGITKATPPAPPLPPEGPQYKPSNKHCEPITAERPGVKCPGWSVAIAQRLLDASVLMGDKRVATHSGMAFVAQVTNSTGDVWHGYPEAWDKIDVKIKRGWQEAGVVTNRDLRRWKTREQVANAWKDRRNDDQ